MHIHNLLRAVVSTPKQSTFDADSWLDLSHITAQLIVAAGPTDRHLTKLYRSPIQKVVQYLDKCHSHGDQANWHIWNLRAEGSGYELTDVTSWTYRPFPDHQPPSVIFLIQIVNEIGGFLQGSARNVALVHCKEGKGRSGTVCCAFLMYEAKTQGILMSTEEAIGIFTRKRMRKSFGRGVSILSQIRYLEYYRRFLQLSDEAKESFWAFHSVYRVSFDSSRSFIDKVTIFGCLPLLAFSNLKLATYLENSDGLTLVTLEDVSLSHMTDLKCHAVELNIPLGRQIKDIRLSFGRQICYAYTWLNLYFETCKSAKTSVLLGEGASATWNRTTANWTEFDGLYGLPVSRSLKMFDKVEILWVLRI